MIELKRKIEFTSKGLEAQRICGKCEITLTPENTGQLQHLQPSCNECTNKYQHECNHHFHHYFINNKEICILCGYINDKE